MLLYTHTHFVLSSLPIVDQSQYNQDDKYHCYQYSYNSKTDNGTLWYTLLR